MKLRKRIAAVVAAMVMATSMMMTSASAATLSKTQNDVKVTSTTTTDSLNGYGSTAGVNTTATTRYMYSVVEIYSTSTNSTLVTENHAFGNASKNSGEGVFSGLAIASRSKCNHIRGKATMYNSQGTQQGGEYGTATITVDF